MCFCAQVGKYVARGRQSGPIRLRSAQVALSLPKGTSRQSHQLPRKSERLKTMASPGHAPPLNPAAGVLVIITLYGGNDGLNT